MRLRLPSRTEFQALCAGDGEFRLAARHWTGGFRLNIGAEKLTLVFRDGQPVADEGGCELIEYSGEEAVWERVLAATPERFHNDLMANVSVGGGITRSGSPVVHGQYYPAVMRAVELLRGNTSTTRVAEGSVDQDSFAEPRVSPARFDTPVGRYVHLDLAGHDHRLYFEEAGQGIPLLLQHTAGCHGSQWRHLFEVPGITGRFHLIAYDLPCHGKSVPPATRNWWAEPYALKGDFLRSVPLQLAAALELDRPVFMGCSVGGLLALDLAHRHPDRFRAVVSVEGALKIEGNLEQLQELWHPQISNEYKARLMEGLMSPASPAAFRKETSWVYSAGWPPVFLGDLHYYLNDFDLRRAAGEINTTRVGVHILSGEYDYSGTAELGRAAHEAIPGSTWREMKGVGHFPMSENPAAFMEHLLPVLDAIANGSG
ncbi:MAG: alpha/beta hydrolase [Pseudomonadales bacterium]